MKITIKTLQQKVFQIDADGEDTVEDVKKRIQGAHGHPVANQKLIYSGKVLPDGKTIEACEIREKDFLVLMVSKPKAAPAGPSTTPAPPVQPVPPVQPIQPPQPTTTELAPQPVEPTTEQPTETPAPSGSSSGFLTGDALRTAIANMEDMGFPIEEVQRAMRASFNNPDRAVEYLMNGIPAHIQAELPPPPPTQQPGQPQPQQTAINPTPAQEPAQQAAPANLFQLAQQQQQQRQHNPGGFGQGGGGLPQLSPEQWARLQELTSRNPNMSQAFIQQIAQANPELIRQLTSNPEFLSRVLEGGEPGDDDGADAIPPGATVLSVTHEERAAIERLEELGFSREQAIEAYFACDKDEVLAANYLYEHGNFDQ